MLPPPTKLTGSLSDQFKNLAEKFAFAYVCLFGLRFFFAFLDANQILTDPYPRLWAPAVRLLGANFLHLSNVAPLKTGSGDTLFDYLEIVCLLVWAAAIALAWEPLARGNTAAEKILPAWTRVLVRFALIGAMFLYGLEKVFCNQIGELTPFTLLQPVGEQSPMAMLWHFMAASKPYMIFTGLVEVVTGALLLFEKTTMLGALLCLAILTDVLMLDISYDVGAKIDCIHFLLFSIILVLPDGRRLLNFFTNRPVDPISSRALLSNTTTRRRAIIAQLALGLIIFATTAVSEYRYSKRNIERNHISTAPFQGAWRVTVDTNDVNNAGARKWQYVFFEPKDSIKVRSLSGEIIEYQTSFNTEQNQINLKQAQIDSGNFSIEPSKNHTLRWSGTLDGKAMRFDLTPINTKTMPLNNQPFRWVIDYPGQR